MMSRGTWKHSILNRADDGIRGNTKQGKVVHQTRRNG
jgi:hypothetical protein